MSNTIQVQDRKVPVSMTCFISTWDRARKYGEQHGITLGEVFERGFLLLEKEEGDGKGKKTQ